MKRRPNKLQSPETVRESERVSQPSASPVSLVSGRRLWLFRLTAVVLSPLLFFLLVELGLRLAGFGYPVSFLLPDRIGGQDVLVQNDRFAWRFFGSDMARTPYPLAISRTKRPGTVRIFVFGESAAYGDPQPEFGLPRMLQVLLSERYPGARFEVVNAAMTAINSHAILPIACDCASRSGDVWVIYMGNNEVVGPFGAGTVFGSKAANHSFIRASLALKATRTGQCLDRLLDQLEQRPATKSEWGGMMMFVQNQVRQDDPRMAAVYAHFKRNLDDILRIGLRSGAKIVVSTVASNLKDCPPFASMHQTGLPAAALAEWDRLYQKATEAEKAGRAAEAVEYFRQADQVDDTFAEMQFRWGASCLALGQGTEALQRFTLARDLDALRFRPDSRINDIIWHAASGREQDGIQFADAQEELAQQSPHGLVGEEFLHEHVHLNFQGNYLLARTLAERVAKLLPETVTQRADAARPWPSAADCARRLAWADWNRYEAKTSLLGRFNDPPFTMQFNHAQQSERLRRQIVQMLPAIQPAALRQSESNCLEALAAAPDDWVLHKNLARLRQKIGDFTGVAESWRRVVQLLPHYAEAWQDLGLALAEQQRDEEAVSAFQQALRLEPASAVPLNGLAQMLARQGKSAEAIRQFERVLQFKPHWGPAHLGLGRTLEATGRPEEAERHFRQALQARILTPSALKALGKLCFEKGWFSEAATNFTDALQLDPADAATHLNLGMTLGLLGRRAEAQVHYAEAVRLDPNLAEARFRFGLELGRQGNDAGAMEQFAEAVRCKPDLLEARLNLGIALRNQRRVEEALAQFQEVLRRNPTNATALEYVRALGGSAPPIPPP
mgnify:CR=1 FL=1